MTALWHAIINPWIWWSGNPPTGWTYGLETYWPIVVQGILVSVALGLVGCFLVVRGTSLLGDALSHSVLPGIVIGFVIGGSLHSPWILIGATAVGMLAALLIEGVHTQSRVKQDAALGIVFTTLFAIGVVLVSLPKVVGQADLDPGCVLYGNIEFFVVKRGGMLPMSMILAGIVLGLMMFYRQLLVSTFDPGLAVSLGIPANLVHYIVMAVLSLTVVASFESVGASLAVALLIMPGATARLWADRMPAMLVIASVHGILATLIGYWLSHKAVLHTSASGAITVAGFGLFVASWLLAPHSGLLMQTRTRRNLRRTILMENLIKAIEELGGGKPVQLSAVAGELRLSTRALETALRRAASAGWIQRTNGQISLTDAGHARSRQLTRAHLLWEQFLQTQVGLPPDHVHDAAEWIEHHLDESELQKLNEILGEQPGHG